MFQLCRVRGFRVRVLNGGFIMRRSRMSRSGSRKLFRNRSGVHPRNRQNAVPMRGGIRL